jgi:hypothetical protein
VHLTSPIFLCSHGERGGLLVLLSDFPFTMTKITYPGPIDSHPDGQGLTSTLSAVSSPTPPASVACDGVAYSTSVSEKTRRTFGTNLLTHGPHQTSPYSFTSSCDHSYDPNILTPISSIGSPTMQQQPRISRGYSPVAGPQQVTPPESAKMRWTAGGSPMTVHPASVSGEQFGMAYSAADAKADDLPENRHSYFGHFTVSAPLPEESPKTDTPDHRRMPHHFYHQQMHHAVSPGVVPGQSPYSIMHNPLPPMPHDSMMSGSLPPGYHRPDEVGPGPSLSMYPSHEAQRPTSMPFRVKKRARSGKTNRSVIGSHMQTMERDAAGVPEHIEFEANASEEWKCVLAAWQQTWKSKGKNQWQEIQDIHERKGFGRKNVQALQMMLTRLKQKGIIWPEQWVSCSRHPRCARFHHNCL